MSVDPRAATGFSVAVEAYEQGRPSYPEEAVALLVRELGLSPESAVLDLAAGTGKLTRELLPFGDRVIAIDASEAMVGLLREQQLPGVTTAVGTADRIPLPSQSVDAVVVAEAFHWFGNAATCREIARVLRPGGGLGLLWNRSLPGPPWQAAVEALSEPHREAAGAFPAEDWRTALAENPQFGPLSASEVEHAQRLDPDGVVALVASWSWIANLPTDERAALLAQVRERVEGEPDLTIRYRTEVYWTRMA